VHDDTAWKIKLLCHFLIKKFARFRMDGDGVLRSDDPCATGGFLGAHVEDAVGGQYRPIDVLCEERVHEIGL